MARKNNKQYGTRKELDTVTLLESEGWVAGRSPASLGAADVWAMKAGERPMLIQVKATVAGLYDDFPPAERVALLDVAGRAGADAWYFHWKRCARKPTRVPSSEWPPDRRGRAKYVVDDNGCWLWQGHVARTGYGDASHDGKTIRAHRKYYVERFGPVPEGKVLHHTCRVRHCVNPDHLRAVEPRSHARTHAATKLTPADVDFIRRSELSNGELGRKLGIDYKYIWAIREGKAWSDYELLEDEG